MTLQRFSWIAAWLAAAMLAGCGGGSGDEVLVGRFVGPAVGNVAYATASGSGRTGADGSFVYRSGEVVTFSIGGVRLGLASAAPLLDVFALVGTAQPPRDAVALAREANRMAGWWNQAATPFETAVNIAVFLQSVDADGDPGNGIAVPETLHAVATSHALRAVHAALGVVPEVFVQTGSRFDDGPAGSPEWEMRWRYDDDGLERGGEIDNGADGSIDSTWEIDYDAAGRETGYRSITPLSGTTVVRSSRTAYDASGFVLRNEADIDGDARTDEIVRFTRHPDGCVRRMGFDRNGDGVDEDVLDFEYDAAGRTVRESLDRGADGTPDELVHLTHDEQGRLRTRAIDRNGDGRIDESETLRRDAAGNLTEREADHDGDGRVDAASRFEYDGAGNLLLRADDRDGDGRPDQVWRYTYDGMGRQTSVEEDLDGNGRTDRRTRFHHDGADHVVREE
jgi:hypothetical protein